MFQDRDIAKIHKLILVQANILFRAYYSDLLIIQSIDYIMGNDSSSLCSPKLRPANSNQKSLPSQPPSKKLSSPLPPGLLQKINSNSNIFEGIDIPDHGQPNNEWLPVDQNWMYKGEWSMGKKHGAGMLYHVTQQYVLIGYFSQGATTNNKYKKIFINNVSYLGSVNQKLEMHGNGKLIEKDYTYQGQFKNNLFHGQGQLQKQKQTFKGQFQDGKKKYGIQTSSEGKYQGPFINQQKQGSGKFFWSNGGRYQGHFQNNKIDGIGKLYDKQGNYCGKHTFQNGKMLI